MKTNFKHYLAIIFLLCSTAASAHDFKVDGIFYNILSEDDKTVYVTYEDYKYDYTNEEYKGYVTIPSTVTYNGIVYSITTIGEDAFHGCTGLISVTIPNSVTSIGDSAFAGCRGLTSVTIGNSVTSIGDYAFSGCFGLTSVTIGNSVTSIGESAFYNCFGLTSVEIPNSVTSIGKYAFYWCSGLTSVTIGNSVTSIGYQAFYNCTGLTSVEIPNSVTSMGDYAFCGCDGLTAVHINDLAAWCKINFSPVDSNPLSHAHNLYLNGEKVTDLVIPYGVTEINSYAFSGCSGLTSVTIPNSVTSIGGAAFSGCTGLTSIEIPNSVTSIGGAAFSGCTGLTSIEIPNSVTSIGRAAFYGCTGLTSIEIPNSVTSIEEDAFNNCTALKELCMKDGETILSLSSVKYLFAGCPLKILYLGRNLSYSISNDESPFYYTGTLNSVVLGKSVTSIPDNLFSPCDTILSLTIPSSVLKISSKAFTDTKLIKTIFLGNTKPDGYSYAKGIMNYVSSSAEYGFGIEYTNLSSMFEVGGVKYVLVSARDRICDIIDCNYSAAAENVVIDSLVSYRNIKLKVRNINDYAFFDNNSIRTADIANNGYIGYRAFNDCDSLKTATLGNSIDSICAESFRSCDKLEGIEISDNTLFLGESSFRDCFSLEKAIVGSGIKTLNESTFSGCTSMNDVKIGENVAEVRDAVFYSCSSLPKIKIPQATKRIDNEVFGACTSLATVIIEDKSDSLVLGYNNYSSSYSSYNPMFSDCPLDSVYVGCRLVYKSDKRYGYSPFYRNKYLRSVTFNDAEVAIYDKEFWGCSNLQNIILGKGIKTIGVSAFAGCSSLAGITIPDWVTYIGNSCFASCSALKSAKVGTGIKTLEWYTFGNCSALTDMQIGVNVDSIGKRVFSNCSSLPQISIPQATMVINDSVFYKCSSLADVIIEDRTTTLRLGSNGSSGSSSATASTNPLFYDCPLDSVYIGGKISYKTEREYGFSPFFRNTSLRTVVVADSETLVYDNEFYGCTGLTDVVIGDGVTNIGDWAFSGCVGLVNFSFGNSVETIGTEAFSDCTSMTKIVSSSDVPPVCGSQALADINVWDCTLFVPNDYIDAYYNAEQWWDFFFIEGAEYLVTFLVDGEVFVESMIKYNAEIILPDEPVKKGYTFVGWGDVPAVMPADNITLNAEFSINNYTITYIVDGEEYYNETVAYNTEIIPIEAPEKSGYAFNRWESLPQAMPDSDIEVVAVYDEIPAEVTISIGQYGATTYSSPYALDFSNVAGLKAYTAAGYNTNSGVVTLLRVNTASAGVGLFITGEPGTYSVPVIEKSFDNSINMLVATTESITIDNTSHDGEYTNFKYTIISGSSTPMFYRFDNGFSLGAGKSYLQIPTSWLHSNAMRSISIEFEEMGFTDIDEVSNDNEGNVIYYDLNGRVVTNPGNGIYIVNGEKVYIEK